MSVNFSQAAKRHFQDAKILEEKKRFFNADQLYCLAAECGLKEMLSKRGVVQTNETGDLVEREYRTHVKELWERYQVAMNEQSGRLRRFFNEFQENPFTDWDISQRYAADDELPNNYRREQHQKAASRILETMEKQCHNL